MTIAIYVLLTLAGYFFGSLSPAVFLSRKFAGYDIRTKGSKNAGSTNVFRVMGPKFGIINFILDLLKGAIPTLIGLYFLGTYSGEVAAICLAGGVILGHAFPVFSHFKGGKCVASSAGILLAFHPVTTAIIIAVAIGSIALTGYVSLASVVVFLVYPIIAWFIPEYTLLYQIFLSCLGALILYLHRGNILRLLKGEENPLVKKKSKK